ncbi:MAG TPA: hypothetical protein VFC10_15995 [Terriglobia bacterium]|nr:hypothetical protein [Terriglobia bacterium]
MSRVLLQAGKGQEDYDGESQISQAQNSRWMYSEGGCSNVRPGKMGQKILILQKRTGEVIENKGSAFQNGTKRTEKRTGEVI